MKKNLSIYVHIPFCIQKCAYCDFLSKPATEDIREAYIASLLRKMERTREVAQNYHVRTIFFGGGTPTAIDAGQLTRLLEKLRELYEIDEEAEISLESNPGTLTAEKLSAYKRAGFNRLSIGLQSTDEKELKLLGRIHTYEDFLKNYQLAREAGFTNINVDLMSGLPGQTTQSWKRTLKKVAALNPQHISAYSLIVEEGTPFYLLYKDDVLKREKGEKPEQLPSEEEERTMYSDTETILASYGYHRYEISNYAKPGYECRHNIAYWTRQNYLGYGLGSASLMDNQRFHATENLKTYLSQKYVYEDITTLTMGEQMEEFMFLGLRMMEGVSLADFYDQFHQSFWDIYGSAYRKLEAQGLIERKENRLMLSKRGIDISNYVMACFLL